MKKRLMMLTLSILTAFAICSCSKKSSSASDNQSNTTATTQTQTQSNTSNNIMLDPDVAKKVSEINTYIDYYYYFETDKQKQADELYRGIMEGLDDPYSVYYTAEEYATLQEDTSGEYVGIGAVVSQTSDMVVTIIRPVPGSPAEEAGLLAGDVIMEIDGTPIVDQELSVVVDMIRGAEGTSVNIKIYRQGEMDYLYFDIERRLVENVSVYTNMLENNIGYIQVTQFYDTTAAEFKAAIDDMEAKNVDGIIIDLRDNPGGVLNAVTDMCSYLMDGGVIVTTKDKNGKVMNEYTAGKDHKIDIPMVVLVNGNSASASEIFAGAMKDTNLAKLVGTTTYGKGIVQSVIPLSDGTAIKITVAKYFTPNGNDIHKIGIEPDVVVELPDGRTNAVNLLYEDDTQLQKAEEVILEMIN